MTPRRVLAVLATAELLAMAPWFSASAVAPTLTRVWHLSPAGTAWLTISVQLGFVAGALMSAVLTLADRFQTVYAAGLDAIREKLGDLLAISGTEFNV